MKTTPLRFDDIQPAHPCALCSKPCGDRFHTICDAETGLVKRVTCDPCHRDEMYAAYQETGRITTSLSMDASMTHYDPYFGPMASHERWRSIVNIHDAMVRVQYIAKLFERSVWFPSIQEIVKKSSTHGLSSKEKFSTPIGMAKFLAYAIAGRAMITLETDDAMVTLITDDTSKESRMGVQGIFATEDEACGLITAAIDAWRDGKIQTVEDTDVGIL